MILARVVEEIVATRKHPSHEGQKILRLQPEDFAGAHPHGAPDATLLALDAAGAGVGDRVLVVLDGYAAMTAVHRPKSPIDAAILGVIDHADLLVP